MVKLVLFSAPPWPPWWILLFRSRAITRSRAPRKARIWLLGWHHRITRPLFRVNLRRNWFCLPPPLRSAVFQRCWGWFFNFGNSGDYGNFGNFFIVISGMGFWSAPIRSRISASSVFQRCWGWFLDFGNSGDYGNFGNFFIRG